MSNDVATNSPTNDLEKTSTLGKALGALSYTYKAPARGAVLLGQGLEFIAEKSLLHFANAGQGKSTLNTFSEDQKTKANAVFRDVFAKVESFRTTPGIITKTQYEELKREIKNRCKSADLPNDEYIENLQKLTGSLIEIHNIKVLVEEVEQKDQEAKEKSQELLRKQIQSFDDRNQALIDENYNMHVYRVLTMVMLCGALDALDIFGNILDNFGGDFAEGVGQTLADSGVFGPFADIARAFGIDKLFTEISKMPILYDINQFAVDLAGSEYLSPFATLGGNLLGSEGAKLAFGMALIGNRLYHEIDIYEKFRNQADANDASLKEIMEVCNDRMDKHNNKMADFIAQRKAQNLVNACDTKAYLKELCNNQLEIPDEFKKIELNPNITNFKSSDSAETSENQANNLFELINQIREKNNKNASLPKHQSEENIAEILRKLYDNKQGYEAIKTQANQWKSAQLNDQDALNRNKALNDEYRQAYQELGNPAQLKDKTFGEQEQLIKEAFIGKNKESILKNIQTGLAPGIVIEKPKAEQLSKASAFVHSQ